MGEVVVIVSSIYILGSCFLAGTGVVLEWEQKASLLYAGGESRLIRIWDAQREMKIQVFVEPNNSVGNQ